MRAVRDCSISYESNFQETKRGAIRSPLSSANPMRSFERVGRVSPPFREVTIWAIKKCHPVGSRIAAFLWVGVDTCFSRGRRMKLPDRATRRPGVHLSDLEHMILHVAAAPWPNGTCRAAFAA